MLRYSSISDLAQAVLDSVSEDESVKTASDETSSTLKTEIGLALKQAAEAIRNFETSEVTDADLVDLEKRAAQPAFPARTVRFEQSPLGEELRKLANVVRESAISIENDKTIKLAQMLTAAVGLKHLTEGV